MHKLIYFSLFISLNSFAQIEFKGKIISSEKIEYTYCHVGITNSKQKILIDSTGNFNFIQTNENKFLMNCNCLGFETKTIQIDPITDQGKEIIFEINTVLNELDEISVLGTIKEVNRLENPIITDVYDKKFFTKFVRNDGSHEWSAATSKL